MAQEFEQLLLKNQLCFPLYACGRKIVSAYTPFLKPLGLTYTQYIVFKDYEEISRSANYTKKEGEWHWY